MVSLGTSSKASSIAEVTSQSRTVDPLHRTTFELGVSEDFSPEGQFSWPDSTSAPDDTWPPPQQVALMALERCARGFPEEAVSKSKEKGYIFSSETYSLKKVIGDMTLKSQEKGSGRFWDNEEDMIGGDCFPRKILGDEKGSSGSSASSLSWLQWLAWGSSNDQISSAQSMPHPALCNLLSGFKFNLDLAEVECISGALVLSGSLKMHASELCDALRKALLDVLEAQAPCELLVCVWRDRDHAASSSSTIVVAESSKGELELGPNCHLKFLFQVLPLEAKFLGRLEWELTREAFSAGAGLLPHLAESLGDASRLAVRMEVASRESPKPANARAWGVALAAGWP